MNKYIDCNYYINNDCCLHPYKLHCKYSSLWTPKGYGRGLRADLSILDDYCGLPQEVIDEVCKPFIKNENNNIDA